MIQTTPAAARTIAIPVNHRFLFERATAWRRLLIRGSVSARSVDRLTARPPSRLGT